VIVAYLSILVLLPVAALVSESATSSFWSTISSPEVRSTLEFTVWVSLVAAAIDAVTGVAIAWVLVRDDFPGKRVVNALIDLPFALPTIVAGLVLLALYGPTKPIGIDVAFTRVAVGLALLFVTLPFVVRAVQPVLLSLERDVEDAAASLGAGPLTTFRRITLPAIMPSLLTGATLAFARCIGEFGSITLLAGTPHTQVGSILISHLLENGDQHGAAAVSVTLLVIALIVFLLLNLVTRRWTRRG
jgi:sulfate transport system permease protein